MFRRFVPLAGFWRQGGENSDKWRHLKGWCKRAGNDFAIAADTVSNIRDGAGLKAVWLDCVGCCDEDDELFVGAGTGAPNLIMESAGLTNAFAEESGSWACVSISSIIASNPDVMVSPPRSSLIFKITVRVLGCFRLTEERRQVIVDASWDSAIEKIDFLHDHSGFCGASFVQRADYITIPFSASTLGPRNGAAALDMVTAAIHVTTGDVVMDFR